jgi:tetratricopeptide (TPR) repeat protein
MGRYLFRDLAAGSYTIGVQNEAQTSTRTVRLDAQPVDLINVDFQISRPVPPDVPVPAPLPVQPQPLAANALNSRSATAQQHNILGRQLSKAGRYREAIVELTEALRIAPDFALAFNARGFALFMLRDCAGAIEDLNKAIWLNPNYGNAYEIRAIARRTIGDALGAAADLKRSQQLVH